MYTFNCKKVVMYILALTSTLLFSTVLSKKEATWAIAADSDITVLQQDSGTSLRKHSNYVVYNIGKDPVWAKIIYGTHVMWHGQVGDTEVDPGEKRIINNLGSDYYITALKIINTQRNRAIVIAGLVSEDSSLSVRESESKLDIDINGYAKFFATYIAGAIPVVGDTLAHCIGFFWPNTEGKDVWESIKKRVSDLIDSKISATIENLLNSNLRRLKRKVSIIQKLLNAGVHGPIIVNHYMTVAQDLIGIEEGFKFKSVNEMDVNKLNYIILPLYSTVITMKLMFYRIGMISKGEFELDDLHKKAISVYAQELLDNNAFEHIFRVHDERLNYEYRNCHPDNLFNALATVETFVGINGLEMIPLWTQWIRQPLLNSTPYRDTVILSSSVGRNTVDLLMEARGGEISEKLIPPNLDKTINGQSVEIRDELQYFVIQYEPRYITSITAYFESFDNVFHMGSYGSKVKYIPVDKAKLKRIVVYGKDIINGLTFNLSDGKTYNLGDTKTTIMATFELSHHHIIGIFVGKDKKDGKNVLVNIAVSYLMDK